MKALICIISILFILELVTSCSQPFTQGKSLYEANCSRCHGIDGKGFEDLYPGILQSEFLADNNTKLACVIAYGSVYIDSQRNKEAEVPMPGNQQLTPVEVLNIINYMSWEYGNKKQIKIEDVMLTLDDCLP